MSEDRVVDGATEEARGGGCFEHLKILVLVEPHKGEPLADIADEEKCLVAAHAPGSDSHAGEGAVDFGEAVQAAGGVNFSCSGQKDRSSAGGEGGRRGTRRPARMYRGKISLGLPGIPAFALVAEIAERFRGFVGGHWPAGAEDPDALLLLQRRGAAPGAQRDLVTLDRNIQSVAWGEVQLVPKCLRKNDAARLIV